MEYKLITLNCDVAVGKTFEFPTSEIQTVDYGKYYNDVCAGMHPSKSYGIYEVGEEVTKFSVAIQTEFPNNYSSYKIHSGDYYQFEIDMAANQKENQYTKCFDTLMSEGLDFDMSYSFEVMEQMTDPSTGTYKYKYYISVK